MIHSIDNLSNFLNSLCTRLLTLTSLYEEEALSVTTQTKKLILSNYMHRQVAKSVLKLQNSSLCISLLAAYFYWHLKEIPFDESVEIDEVVFLKTWTNMSICRWKPKWFSQNCNWPILNYFWKVVRKWVISAYNCMISAIWYGIRR